MPLVSIHLPSLLADAAGGSRHIAVEGLSVGDVLQNLSRAYPKVGVHLFDERGDLREHVLCFLNEKNTRWLESLDHLIQEGDELTILQAVSGG